MQPSQPSQPSIKAEAGKGNIWILPALFGLPGLYDAVAGISGQNFGMFLSGFGHVLCATFLILQGARLTSGRPLQWTITCSRDSSMVAALGYAGIILAASGFLIKRGLF